MSKETNYLTIHKDKNGEWDFGVLASIQDLNQEEIDRFRIMCVVGIRVADQMWYENQFKTERAREVEEPSLKLKERHPQRYGKALTAWANYNKAVADYEANIKELFEEE